MNRTLVFLHLFLTSLSIARQIDETTTTNIEYANYKINRPTLRINDETDDDLPVLLRKDDVISTSDLNKIYSSLENKFAQTRYLKADEIENEGLKTADSKQESRTANSELINKRDVEPEERSDTAKAAESETRDMKKVEIKSSRRSSASAIVEDESKTADQETKSDATAESIEESKSATKEESKQAESSSTTAKTDSESKDAMKEEIKAKEFTSEFGELEKTTTSFRRAIKDANYLQNEKDDINAKFASDEDSDRKTHINDESNSSWDLLDDLPASRRAMSQPNNKNIEVKAKDGDEIVEPVEPRNVPDTKITARNHISRGPPTAPVIPIPQIRSTISVPHIHPAIIPQRRIVPGFVKVRPPENIDFRSRPPKNIDFRRELNQERNNVINQNIQDRQIVRSGSNHVNPNVVLSSNERSEIPFKSRDVNDYNFEDLSNAYPYTNVDNINTPETPKAANGNQLFAKLVEASEHPQRFVPFMNGENVQNFPSVPYSNNMNPPKSNYIVQILQMCKTIQDCLTYRQ
ncbi:enolase-phosphatase E1-like isoform X2 [Maniola hyperantus]|uniref:enolase-phosphatase E1-like isoform X2 n=1 Tax=Aphantopus hyperantus TaxID=2795564 RepID=UPI0037495AF4